MRLFLRLFAFTCPLYLTVMYTFWIFKGPSMTLWIGHVVVMVVLELAFGLFAGRPFSKTLLKPYVVLALFLKFPSVLLESALSGDFSSIAVFLPWVSLRYGSLLLLSGSLKRSTDGRSPFPG